MTTKSKQHSSYGEIPITEVKAKHLDSNALFSILLPSWNNLDFLKLCISSLEKNSKFPHQIIVHINEGKDGTLEWVQEKGLAYTYSKQNVGICYALNAAAKLATTDYIVYLNDDMYVAPDWDMYFWEEIKKNDSKLFFFSGTMVEPVDTAVNRQITHSFGLSASTFNEQEFLSKVGAFEGTDWYGASWPHNIVHREVWDAVGGYSVEFSPGFYSDPDFSMKLWKLGVRNFKGISKSRVYHFSETSTKRLKRKVVTDAKKLFLRKWGISASTFYKFYLRMDEPYNRLLNPPKKTLKFICKLLVCKLKNLFS